MGEVGQETRLGLVKSDFTLNNTDSELGARMSPAGCVQCIQRKQRGQAHCSLCNWSRFGQRLLIAGNERRPLCLPRCSWIRKPRLGLLAEVGSAFGDGGLCMNVGQSTSLRMGLFLRIQINCALRGNR